MDYISKNIDDMTIQELTELCQNPEKYNLKWGEYMKIMAGIEKAMNLSKGGSDDTRIRQLEARVAKLEQKITNIVSLLSEFYSAMNQEED
jgi:hypothetical protein